VRRVAIVVSSPTTIRAFLRHQIDALSERYEVWVFANVRSAKELAFLPDDVNIVPIRIERKPSPFRDTCALVRLVGEFREHHFDLVHSTTPKAGFLAMIASFIARVPVRIHTFGGEVWVNRDGASRRALKATDKLTAALATEVLVVSPSERQFLLDEGVVTERKSRVLANGSISGVDTNRFRPDPVARRIVRRQLAIDDETVLFMFVGRLNRAKGVPLLVEAFRRLNTKGVAAALVFVGPDEEGLANESALFKIPGVRFVGESDVPEKYMAAADVLCLPSQREGFSIALIEAGAAGLPSVASDIYGITDALVDGVTGLLHVPDDVDDLLRCMSLLLLDPDLRKRLGAAGKERVRASFRAERVTDALLGRYHFLLEPAGAGS
jgi:glycosyltransferase involved in cell wall biosynthesis